ncbi:MAG TPA: molybdopterin dinucleotide binding domain-containing protein, partial [Iamia sp.]|nr:molybdopterin dinucleotide binding domain-containing protein [Iamia sp.]
LWVTGTNPAVSMPELSRIRSILAQDRLFLVVQDIFLTETAQLADVVLPAATWAEKTGCFTNADRTVHLSERAVDPPGEARSDLDIWLDLARRLDLRTRSGGPLIGWSDASGAFDAWAECSRGRPCDYSGLSHDRLRGAPGIQWPCDADRPDGTARLYTDGHFATTPGDAEDFGHDLATGAVVPPDEYKARRPDGRAFLRAAPYEPAPEPPDDAHPLHLATGRTVHHIHTRTKTGRTPELEAAAPEPWVELHPDDAAERGLADGDTVRVESATGAVEVPLRITGIRPGVVFLPFHYGWWDDAGHDPAGGRVTAANALVAVRWDPVSKQPAFKVGAVTVTTTGG